MPPPRERQDRGRHTGRSAASNRSRTPTARTVMSTRRVVSTVMTGPEPERPGAPLEPRNRRPRIMPVKMHRVPPRRPGRVPAHALLAPGRRNAPRPAPPRAPAAGPGGAHRRGGNSRPGPPTERRRPASRAVPLPPPRAAATRPESAHRRGRRAALLDPVLRDQDASELSRQRPGDRRLARGWRPGDDDDPAPQLRHARLGDRGSATPGSGSPGSERSRLSQPQLRQPQLRRIRLRRIRLGGPRLGRARPVRSVASSQHPGDGA